MKSLGWILVLALAAFASPATAMESDSTPAEVVVDVDPQFADRPATVRVRVSDADGAALATQDVILERLRDGSWRTVTWLVTDQNGAASARVTPSTDPALNRFRARVPAAEGRPELVSQPSRLELRKRAARLRVRGASSVLDGRLVSVRIRWQTRTRTSVRGRVMVDRRLPGDRWRLFRKVRTDASGRAKIRVRPVSDTRWRARTFATSWVEPGRSKVHRVRLRPPFKPVKLPAGVPGPRISLPKQPRAVGSGANPRITVIPDGVWQSMVGRSWHRGCPVGRASLRLLRINYVGFDGFRYRGEVVAHAAAIGRMSRALSEMHRRGLPIRRMYRVDRFGWSRRLQGADDYKSMAADNTSGFNCRSVVGRPGVRSPHSSGFSLDVNPWENPYLASHGWTPSRAWVGRSHPEVAWRSGSHPVVRIMRNNGLRWTYGTRDAHHFDAHRHGRSVEVPPICRRVVCH